SLGQDSLVALHFSVVSVVHRPRRPRVEWVGREFFPVLTLVLGDVPTKRRAQCSAKRSLGREEGETPSSLNNCCTPFRPSEPTTLVKISAMPRPLPVNTSWTSWRYAFLASRLSNGCGRRVIVKRPPSTLGAGWNAVRGTRPCIPKSIQGHHCTV